MFQRNVSTKLHGIITLDHNLDTNRSQSLKSHKFSNLSAD
jgi:hypothetical protein